MGKKLKIKLLPNGKVEMVTEGVKGKKCEDYIQFLEKIGDLKVEKLEHTPEYYETELLYNSDEVVNKQFE